jgi:hypothetical protein
MSPQVEEPKCATMLVCEAGSQQARAHRLAKQNEERDCEGLRTSGFCCHLEGFLKSQRDLAAKVKLI